jgi:HD-like signal output (HDOD) protein
LNSVLFVDDEPLLLAGLRNLLRKERERWDMSFVASGSEALEFLAHHHRDIVVSDMRMAGMDGAELLTQIRERHPRTARVILTGQASKDDLVRALCVAQQILSKPCDRAVLCGTLERIFKVQELLANEKIAAFLGGIDRLPSFPKSYDELSRAMLREDVTTADIAGIVKRDPALSAKALSIANSAYFGLSRPTTSIHTAVSYLGFQLLRALALGTTIFSSASPSLFRAKRLENLPACSLIKAQLAQKFVTDRAAAEEAFAAALLLDIGHIVLAKRGGDDYVELLERADSGTRPVEELEHAQLGFTHAEAGGYVLGLWGLPMKLVEIVSCHHEPSLMRLQDCPVAAAVHVADVAVDAMQAGAGDPMAGVKPYFRDHPGVASHLEGWRKLAAEAWEAR